jgi:ABC-type branched-subunit amino acid transport system substrate-binding protein
VPTGGTVTDFSPYVSKILAGKPDAVMVSTDFQTAPGMIAALKAAGYKGLIYNYVAYIPGLLSAPGQQKLAAALDGTYANTQFPPAESGGEGITQFVSDLKAVGDPGFVSQGGSIGYWSADLFVQMVKAVGPNLTSDNFNKLINGGFKSQPPASGGLGEIDYPDGHHHPAPCAALVKVQGTQFVVTQPFKCYSTIPAK